MTDLEKLCHALNKAHDAFIAAENDMIRTKQEAAEAFQAFYAAKSALENAKDDVLRAVGEDVDNDHYRRGVE